MWLLHLVHRLIILSLTLITFSAIAGVFLLLIQIKNSNKLSYSPQAGYTSSPNNLPSNWRELAKPPEVLLKFGDKIFATPSATLLRIIPANNPLFIHLLVTPSHQTWDEMRVRAWLTGIYDTLTEGAKPPLITYNPRLSFPFTIYAGSGGQSIEIQSALNRITHSTVPEVDFELTAKIIPPPLDDLKQNILKNRLSKLKQISLEFTADGKSYFLLPKDLPQVIGLEGGFDKFGIQKLIGEYGKSFNIEVVEPQLVIEGRSVKKFVAPVSGRKLEIEKNIKVILTALSAYEERGENNPKELAVIKEEPKTTLASLNNLGISERIGLGISEYNHSIPNRVKNVALTAKRIHGTLIMPQETFSFNQTLGTVSAATGFLPAYVISQGQTVLGDGGGVCQVSSTLFRTILDAGLPITARRGHSYRVGYYEQNSRPGFDATVFAPNPDLKFVNDTDTPLLINAQTDSENLKMYIEIYGKRDGRKAQILDYKQWGASSPPPPVYQDDPNLPRGVLRQIDFAAGGLKTSFTYRVTYKDGTNKDQVFNTTYTPWRAVYLRGTRI